MCTLNVCSRRYTPDFHSHHWHPSTFPSMTVRLVSQHRKNQCQVSVAGRGQLASSWCLLRITCQPCVFFFQRSKQMEIPRPHSTTHMCDWLWYYDFEVMIHPPYSPDLTTSDFQLFEPYKKQLAGKWFATDTNMKKMPHPGCKQLTPSSSMLGYKPWDQNWTKV